MLAQDSGTGGRKDPFRAALPLGTVGDIQIRVDLSTAAIFALIAFGLAAWQFPAVNPYQATLTYALAAVVTTVGFFASLLAHELAHSLVARHYGLTVNSFTLWLLGVVFVGLALLVGTGHPARAGLQRRAPGRRHHAQRHHPHDRTVSARPSPRHGPTGRAASQGRRTSAAIAGASTHRRLFTISTFTSTHQFRLRDSEPRRLEHASAAVDCLAAPGT